MVWRVSIRAGAGVRVGAVDGLWLLLWFKFSGSVRNVMDNLIGIALNL